MSLMKSVSAIASFVKVRHLEDKPVIDNLIFRAHYRLTTCIFFAGCIFVTATNLMGEPIQCLADKALPEKVINTFCWVKTTFTAQSLNKIYPAAASSSDNFGDRIYHSYYQWVPFMLFFHGICFYLPHWIWKTYEGGDIKMISNGIRGTAITDNADRKKKRTEVVDFLVTTLHMHGKYAYVYFLCELLNLINVIGTVFLIDIFLNGMFLTYGIEVLKFAFADPMIRTTDPMMSVFPRMTKCVFHKYGASGTIQSHDALCVLALNNLNEKIYIFIWFWLLFLGVLSFFAVLYTAALIAAPSFRRMIIIWRFKFGSRYDVHRLVQTIHSGDFLLLHSLSLNLNTVCFRNLLVDLNNKLDSDDDRRPKSHSDNIPSNNINSHLNNQYPIYPDNLNTMDTIEIDRIRPSDPLIRNRKENVKSV